MGDLLGMMKRNGISILVHNTLVHVLQFNFIRKLMAKSNWIPVPCA